MDVDMGSRELIELLTRRISCLNAVEEGATDMTTLIEALDMSESAIYKVIRELQEGGIIRESKNGYELTMFGELAHESVAQLESVCETQPLFSTHWAGADLPISVIHDGELIRASEQEPFRPTQAFDDLLQRADSVRCLTDVAIESQLTILQEQAESDSLVQLIITEDIIDATDTTAFEILTNSGAKLYETDRYPRTKLLLVEIEGESVVGIGVGDEYRVIKGLIITDTDQAVSWAKDKFDRYRNSATRIESVRQTE